MTTFALTKKAKADLKNIARYTQKRWGHEQRNKYLKALDDSFHRLAQNPVMGRDCSDIKNGYRKFPTGNHVIFYRPKGDHQVKIIRILHENMDVNAQLAKN